MIGSARDIVEQVAVPRFLFTDFPLGNPCGRPWDVDMQLDIVHSAISLMASAFAPRTTVQSRYQWSEDQAWRDRFMEVATPDAI